MADLGEALVLMHGARNRFRAVTLEARTWVHGERARRALAQHAARASGAFTALLRAGAGEQPATSSSVTRVWWVKPERLREEQEDLGGGGGAMVRVVDGPRFWFLAGDELHSSDDTPGASSPPNPHLAHLLDPAVILPVLDLRVTGEAIQAGRPALRVEARPRDVDPPLAEGHLPWGADEHELLVDRATGVLLRVASFIDGEEFAVIEVTSIRFDEVIDEERFVLVPPPGVRRAAPPPMPRHPTRDVPLDQAANSAPFRLLVPQPPPRGLTLAQVLQNIDHPSLTPQVTLLYLAASGTGVMIIESAVGATPPGDIVEEVVERGGRQMMVTRSTPPRVRVELHGTDARLSGGAPLDDLLDLAASLTPYLDEGGVGAALPS
ncbi:MAG: hypothetical protein AB1416_06380 [Actinomycetota bacterium]